jgi:fructose-1,6-bisphosphatase I
MKHLSPIVTVQQHVLEEQPRFRSQPGEFSWLLSGLTLAAKMIQAKVRRAGLSSILGDYGATNVQGESQQKLDVFSNEALMHCLGLRPSIGIIASEENESPVIIHQNAQQAR